MRQLVDLYFDVHNNYVPILHRPTFERAVAAGEHTESVDFGEVVLLVCALGARWCGDRGVLVGVGNDDGTIPDGKARDAASTGTPFGDGYEGDDEEDWHSAGWKWFKQVRIARKMLLHAAPNLYDLQIAAVSTTFFPYRGADPHVYRVYHSSLRHICAVPLFLRLLGGSWVSGYA